MNTLVINKEDLSNNIKNIKKYLSKSGVDDNGNPVRIIAVVKANGYGLGIVEYTKFLISQGISFFAVSTIEEALTLRQAGIEEKILMLSPIAIESEVRKLIENNIILTIGSKEDAKIVEKIGKELDKKIRVHLKIDTGFGRYGFVYSKRDEMVEVLKVLEYIEIEGTFTHFSVSFYDDKYTKIQFDRFLNVIEILKLNEIETGILHVCNSAAFLKYPYMHLNAVRIGSAILGRLPFKSIINLKKIGYLETCVTEIKELPKGFNIGYSNSYKTKKETKIAILPCGYMTGINMELGRDMFRFIDKIRYLYNDVKLFFKKQYKTIQIKNEPCRILGRIGAYHVICDITNKEIKIGDKAKIEINPMFIDSNVRREYKE